MPEIKVNLIAHDSVTIEITKEQLEETEKIGYLSDELIEKAIEEADATAYWDIDDDYPYEIEE